MRTSRQPSGKGYWFLHEVRGTCKARQLALSQSSTSDEHKRSTDAGVHFGVG